MNLETCIGQANSIDLLVCTSFGSEAATQITLPKLKQHFCFYSDANAVFGVHGDRKSVYHPSLTRCLNRAWSIILQPILHTSTEEAYEDRLAVL